MYADRRLEPPAGRIAPSAATDAFGPHLGTGFGAELIGAKVDCEDANQHTPLSEAAYNRHAAEAKSSHN